MELRKKIKIYEEIWKKKKFFGEIPLGDEFYMLKNTKNLFYHIFTQKAIPKEARNSLILALSSDNEDDILQTIINLKKQYKVN